MVFKRLSIIFGILSEGSQYDPSLDHKFGPRKKLKAIFALSRKTNTLRAKYQLGHHAWVTEFYLSLGFKQWLLGRIDIHNSQSHWHLPVAIGEERIDAYRLRGRELPGEDAKKRAQYIDFAGHWVAVHTVAHQHRQGVGYGGHA